MTNASMASQRSAMQESELAEYEDRKTKYENKLAEEMSSWVTPKVLWGVFGVYYKCHFKYT